MNVQLLCWRLNVNTNDISQPHGFTMEMINVWVFRGIYHEWWMDMRLSSLSVLIQLKIKMNSEIQTSRVFGDGPMEISPAGTHKFQAMHISTSEQWHDPLPSTRSRVAGLTGLSTGCCGTFRWWCGVPFYHGCNLRHADTGRTVIWWPHELLGWC